MASFGPIVGHMPTTVPGDVLPVSIRESMCFLPCFQIRRRGVARLSSVFTLRESSARRGACLQRQPGAPAGPSDAQALSLCCLIVNGTMLDTTPTG